MNKSRVHSYHWDREVDGMKRLCTALAAAVILLIGLTAPVVAAPVLDVDVPAALLMEKETGIILFEKNAHEKREPASVTKVMTLLLVMEAIDSGRLKYDDTVTVSAHAASMGGSQTWMKEHEQMSVHDMLKTVAVVSANDGSVALAEHLAGSEQAFVSMMNERAKQLGMNDTTFVNCTGLPAQGHVTSVYDIAVMSRELILNHPDIRQFTTIWMDTIRDGAFQLSNTNKLIRYYEGATGLKTGSTDSARFCLSATAERDGMELIAVVMGGETSDKRFEAAKTMLNYGFANYGLKTVLPDRVLPPIDVILGQVSTVQPVLKRDCQLLIERTKMDLVTTELELAENVEAPVEAGQKIGSMTVYVDGQEWERIDIVAEAAVERLSMGNILSRLLKIFFMSA